MNQFKKITALSVSLALVGGCATSSKDVPTTYVSPMMYQQYDCAQLAGETQRIQARVSQLGGRLDEAATNDKTITAVSAVLFWPALFFVGGTKQQEAEFGRVKGEYDAVQQAAIAKKCSAVTPASATGGQTPAK